MVTAVLLLTSVLASASRKIAHRVLLRTVQSNAFAERVLASELAKCDERVSAADRALATELVYGVLRTGRSLDYQLTQLTSSALTRKTRPSTLVAMRLGAYELLHLSTPDFAAVDEAVNLAGVQRPQRAFVNGVLRNLVRRRATLPRARDDPSLTPLEALAIDTSTPEWVLHQLSSHEPPLLPTFEALSEWAVACQQQPPLALRVNRRRASPEDVHAQLVAAGLAAERVDGLEDALLLRTAGGRVSSLPGFREGHFTVQDVGAQCVGWLAAPSKAGATVLDLCSAPGGKATHLAELVGGDGGRVLAVEAHARRSRLIEQACERLGVGEELDVRVADATSTDALRELLASRGWTGGVDAVVLDAPCSGLGTLRRNPEHRYREFDPRAHAQLCELQAALLDAAATCVRPGGTLTYSVCSPLQAETEQAIAAFLGRHEGRFEIVPVSELRACVRAFAADSEQLGGAGTCVRTWTHLHPADSHFACQCRRVVA